MNYAQIQKRCLETFIFSEKSRIVHFKINFEGSKWKLVVIVTFTIIIILFRSLTKFSKVVEKIITINELHSNIKKIFCESFIFSEKSGIVNFKINFERRRLQLMVIVTFIYNYYYLFMIINKSF